jgi:cysteine desulfurase
VSDGRRIYLDHHATTPISRVARDAMVRALDEVHGNASSVHHRGRLARKALEDARAQLATNVGSAPREIVFTSGGTEAVHLAVGGVGDALEVTRVLCDPAAHPCLRAASEALAARRGVAFEWIPTTPEGEGTFDLDALASKLCAGAFVAVSAVQHETGAVCDLRTLHPVVANARATWVLDAAQALGKIDLDVAPLGAAAVTLSAHKIGGPQGVGALWLRTGERVVQRQTGGAQERGVRAGTENLLGAVGFGAAASTLPERRARMGEVGRLRDRLEAALVACGGVVVNGASRHRAPTACHVSIEGVHGHELVAALDLEGIEVSSGAACSSGRAEPSESLLRLYPEAAWRATSALRVTLGVETTDDEIERACAVIPAVIARHRS